jgi:MFS family permease
MLGSSNHPRTGEQLISTKTCLPHHNLTPKEAFNSSPTMLSLQRQNQSQDNDSTSVTMMIFPIVLPLLTVYISNQWSRSSIYYLVDFSPSATPFTAINTDIGFSQAQYGILASVAFTALFAVASLFAGGLADTYDRKRITVGSAILWSLATVATAFSMTYEQVVMARIVMGLVCAFSTPSAFTLIRDLVPKERIAVANSIYSGGVYLGGGLSSLSILLDQNLGWRVTCYIIAIFGLMAALLSSYVLPVDPKMKDNSAPSIRSKQIQNPLKGVGDILTTNTRIQWLFAGSFFRFCSGLMIGVWAAPYYKAAFPEDAASYAIINAFIVGLCGVTSGIMGGVLADNAAKWAEGNGYNANLGRLAIPITGTLLAIPTWWLTAHASTFDTAMVWLAVEYLVAECWFGPTVAVLQSEVMTGLGGTAQGLFTLTGALGNFAPSILGFVYGQQVLSESGSSSSELLSTLLANGVCTCYLISATCFLLSASSNLEEDVNSKQA